MIEIYGNLKVFVNMKVIIVDLDRSFLTKHGPHATLQVFVNIFWYYLM